jgi:hypothetical protein
MPNQLIQNEADASRVTKNILNDFAQTLARSARLTAHVTRTPQPLANVDEARQRRERTQASLYRRKSDGRISCPNGTSESFVAGLCALLISFDRRSGQPRGFLLGPWLGRSDATASSSDS